MDWSLIISGVALSISTVTYIIHDRKIKNQESLINSYQLNKIEEEKLDKQKAFIKANAIKGEKRKVNIKVFNAGKSSATNINFKVLSDENFRVLNPDIFPYELLNAQEGTELLIVKSEYSPDKLRIQFSWDDDYRKGNIYTQVLTI